MTEGTTPSPPPPPEAKVGKGLGCLYGGLAVIASSFIGGIIAGIVAVILPDSAGAAVAVFALLLPIGILIAAGVRWKTIPGFLLGIGLTIALQITVFTGCVALISASLASQ